MEFYRVRDNSHDHPAPEFVHPSLLPPISTTHYCAELNCALPTSCLIPLFPSFPSFLFPFCSSFLSIFCPSFHVLTESLFVLGKGYAEPIALEGEHCTAQHCTAHYLAQLRGLDPVSDNPRTDLVSPDLITQYKPAKSQSISPLPFPHQALLRSRRCATCTLRASQEGPSSTDPSHSSKARTVPYCTALHYTVLCPTVLYRIALHYPIALLVCTISLCSIHFVLVLFSSALPARSLPIYLSLMANPSPTVTDCTPPSLPYT
jgi:hypothetical protein